MIRVVKDTLFPINCFGCNKEGVWLCDPCLTALDTSGVFCCSTTKGLTAEIAVTEYHHESALGRLVWAYKYHYAGEIGDVLGAIAGRFIASHASWFAGYTAIVPIPLHPRRLCERGFNQSAVLASAVGRSLGIQTHAALKRTRYTAPQARLSKDERLKNVANVFIPTYEARLNGQRVILVDDIYTTGSTLLAAAKSLKAMGAGEIIAFTLARAT